ncbi:FAD-dependent monooxygenase [Candidatus Chlamydia sanziniae]|uniref:Monooxygenase n=1 Tax=Candidatus Chlamydia sanziniae TaxID=1806891 RepID=A0A1A9HVR8_9CHLA|nr:FAD-dependent monooxygenase [Candidatus Chlamydia sanziniae]ANH78935.1 Monooxygenase [Candidatus Chlamydia sanziniae]
MADILVIGANPTGLILANMLIQHGITTKVIDHRSTPEDANFLDIRKLPIILSCSSLELLHNGGLLGNFVKNNHKLFGARYHWKKRTLLFKFSQAGESPLPFSLSTTYQEFEKHLIHMFLEHGGVIDWATRPVTLVDNNIFIESTKISQNFEKRKIYHPHWIIASEADNNSDIKDLVKNQIKIRKAHREVVFINCDEGQSFEEDHIHLLPVTKHFLNFVFYNPQERTKQLCLPQGIHGLSPKLKHKLLYTYNLVIADEQYHIKTTHSSILPSEHGNLLFLGSLSHNLVLSYLNGINANIHAAFNLAWKLLPVLKKVASKYLVVTKEQENGNILPHISETTEKRAKKLPFSRLYAPALMYYFLKGCRKLNNASGEYYYPPHQALKYRFSDIIKISPQDKEILGPGPGMRAIDFHLNEGTFLLDPLKSSKHLLIFFKDRIDLQRALQEEYGEWVEVITIKDPRILKLYHANANSLFIIRPDRYIGYRTHTFKLHELISYLLRIFATEKID